MIRLDIDFVFDQTGGPRGLLTLLSKYIPDHDLTYPQVQMWSQRRNIAGAWVPAVIYALIRDGASPLSCFLDDTEFSP